MNDLISVRDVAAQHGKRKQTVFKILKRLGIRTRKERSASGKNQVVAYITQDELKLVKSELLAVPTDGEADVTGRNGADFSGEQGVFYLIQLEPEFDPGR